MVMADPDLTIPHRGVITTIPYSQCSQYNSLDAIVKCILAVNIYYTAVKYYILYCSEIYTILQ